MAENKLFRKAALEKLSSPEQLDQTLRITNPAGWIALLAIGVLLICALCWGIWGTIPTHVNGTGILLSRGGNYSISVPTTGRLENLYFSAGDTVQSGQIVAVIAQPALGDKVAAARAKLEELKALYSETKKFYTENTEFKNALRRQQRLNLQLTNDSLRNRIKLMQQRLVDQKRLLRLGLITKQDILKTEEQINSAKQQVRQNKNSLQGFGIKKLQSSNQMQQKLVSLHNQIVNTRQKLADSQHSLSEDSLVVTPFAGRVVAVNDNVGDTVTTGAPLMTIELAGKHARFLEAALFVDAAQGKRIQSGMHAQVSPGTAKKDMYGAIVGLVTKVSSFPASPQEMNRVLQNKDLVSALSHHSSPIEIRVALVPDPRTPSMYKWTSSRGPGFPIRAGTLCSGSVTVTKQAPISLLIPLAKKYILGQ